MYVLFYPHMKPGRNHQTGVKINFIVDFLVLSFSHSFIFFNQMLDLINVYKIQKVRQSCMK